jgi:hypothetical protein
MGMNGNQDKNLNIGQDKRLGITNLGIGSTNLDKDKNLSISNLNKNNDIGSASNISSITTAKKEY